MTPGSNPVYCLLFFSFLFLLLAFVNKVLLAYTLLTHFVCDCFHAELSCKGTEQLALIKPELFTIRVFSEKAFPDH